MTKKYVNRWGRIKQVKLPTSIVKGGHVALPSHSLAVLLVLLRIAKNRPVGHLDAVCTVRIGQEKLIQLTGYSKNVISDAIKELQNLTLIEPIRNRKQYGEFGATEYVICNPKTGIPLDAKRDVIYGNLVSYFTFPECVITEHTANWSLAKMSSSELKLYTSILYLANRHKCNELQATAADMRGLSGLGPPTFRKALDELECRGLVWVSPRPKAYHISLCDPYTGQPLEEPDGDDEGDPANYFTTGDKGQAKRLNLNTGNPEQIEKLIESCVAEVVRQGNGDLMIECPFHRDSNPSCSVSPRKNGCFHCFGCGQNGSLIELIMQLDGTERGEAIQRTAKAMGMKIEFRQPDEKALAIYSYRTDKRKLVKQVLRYPDANGHKVFGQRRPGKGGWIWNTSGCAPTLFNADSLILTGTVCITEGEKDAVTVTDLHIPSTSGDDVIGVTSGGSESWDASLAKQLHGYRVVLMPDADEAGAKYAADVKASLDAEGIEYRVVSFDDAGAKDVTDFLNAGHTVEELAQRIGTDWVDIPGEQHRKGEFQLPGTEFTQMDIAI